ncbi:MAG: hypothetical protein NPMRTH1_1190024 [Nitrosopumilales archaeon]|nr:MAG: hypothetical protein NPMRTH1_1190024 [Nitrosopumilales archaeon]
MPRISKAYMPISFVAKIAKSGTDSNGNERRIVIIPIDRLKDVTKYNGKQVKVTIDEI